MISRFFDFSSKPGSCPESPVSPRNPLLTENFLSKGGRGVLSDHDLRRRSGSSEDLEVSRNRPFCALIWNLGGWFKVTPSFAGLITFFAEPTQPGSCPDQQDSPRITA